MRSTLTTIFKAENKRRSHIAGWLKCRALIFGRKAAALELLGKIEEAIECCDSGLDIDPGNFVILGLKGECLYMKGQFEKAIACFNEVLRINPKDEMAKKQ